MDEKLDDETLQVIEDCGSAAMSLEETLEIAEIDRATWNAHPEAARTYRRGQLKAKMSIRNAIVKGAKSGNSALLKVYREFSRASKSSRIDVCGEFGSIWSDVDAQE